jgi:hypothetical protein
MSEPSGYPASRAQSTTPYLERLVRFDGGAALPTVDLF